jgi:enoyl-CoA hydratase/carnithine racemase
VDPEAVAGSSAGSVRAEPDGGVLVVVLDRPARRNALDETMIARLRAVLDEAAGADGVEAVVLTGAGEAFCAGADVSRFEQRLDGRSFRRGGHELTELVGAIERIEKPVVAAVNGVTVGLGVQLALACDLRVAAENARFLFSEGRLGLLPTHGGVARLVKLVGLARARDVLLSSRPLEAARAYELGLLTEVVPDDQLLPAAKALAADALRRAPQSYGLTKRLLLLAASADLESAIAAETIAQSVLVGTEDHQEGLRALRDRREPRFTGR